MIYIMRDIISYGKLKHSKIKKNREKKIQQQQQQKQPCLKDKKKCAVFSEISSV